MSESADLPTATEFHLPALASKGGIKSTLPHIRGTVVLQIRECCWNRKDLSAEHAPALARIIERSNILVLLDVNGNQARFLPRHVRSCCCTR